ncbi:MAG TPA: hypothetical protein VK749_26075 [Xanthobacteraceae bacterium]|jgi:hypothetical protein|nr:hypothetical protein [Xanthobacteraceae bacterium]
MSDNDGKIYVDASLPATLRNGAGAIRCPTLQEAVIAWHQLPEAERERATILVDGKTVYTASEIVRLHYRFENDDDSTQASDWEPLESDRGSVVEKLFQSGSSQEHRAPSTIPGTAAIRVNAQEFLDSPRPSTALAGTARAGAARAGATSALTFEDEEAVKTWLEGQSNDVTVVFAARAALRVAALASYAGWPTTGERPSNDAVLRMFRAVSTAWAVAAYPGHRRELNEAAQTTFAAQRDTRGPAPIQAAKSACATASGAAHFRESAALAIQHALDAAGSMGREAFVSLLQSLATDASLLSDRFSPVTLAFSQLWPGNVPDWIMDFWKELRASLAVADEDWEVWTDWYEDRLYGRTANQNAEIARVTIENQIWEGPIKSVNAHIKTLLEEREIFDSAIGEKNDSLPDPNEIPKQAPAGSQFAANSEGLIDVIPRRPVADDLQRQLYEEVRYKARALSELGHNQLAGLSEPVARFLAAAPDRIQGASITQLWSRGNTLRHRLKAHDTAMDSADPMDPAILSRSVAELLRDLVDTYNVFIAGDPTGRELDQVRLGPQERQQADVALDLAETIAEAVQTSEGLATPAAVDTLVEQVESARTAPAGVDGDQAVELSRKTVGNFVSELLRSGYAFCRAEALFGAKETRAGAYRAVGAGAAVAVGPYAIKFIVENAQVLTAFVEQTFHNPALIKIIELISSSGVVH